MPSQQVVIAIAVAAVIFYLFLQNKQLSKDVNEIERYVVNKEQNMQQSYQEEQRQQHMQEQVPQRSSLDVLFDDDYDDDAKEMEKIRRQALQRQGEMQKAEPEDDQPQQQRAPPRQAPPRHNEPSVNALAAPPREGQGGGVDHFDDGFDVDEFADDISNAPMLGMK
jgi:hypothetical protein